MTCADHPDSGGALDHLHLLPQLETDSLPLVDVEVHRVLTGPALTAAPTLAHGHSHTRVLTRVLVGGFRAGLVAWPSLVGIVDWVVRGLLPVREGGGYHVVWGLVGPSAWTPCSVTTVAAVA